MEVVKTERIEEEVKVEDAPSMSVLERLHRLEKITEYHEHRLDKHTVEVGVLNEVVGV